MVLPDEYGRHAKRRGGVLPLTGLLDLDNQDTLSGFVDEADWMELLVGTPVGHETVEITSSCYGVDIMSGEISFQSQ
jgi:hypothetical protein